MQAISRWLILQEGLNKHNQVQYAELVEDLVESWCTALPALAAFSSLGVAALGLLRARTTLIGMRRTRAPASRPSFGSGSLLGFRELGRVRRKKAGWRRLLLIQVGVQISLQGLREDRAKTLFGQLIGRGEV